MSYWWIHLPIIMHGLTYHLVRTSCKLVLLVKLLCAITGTSTLSWFIQVSCLFHAHSCHLKNTKKKNRTADVWEYFLHSLESSLSAMYICGTIILVYHHRFIHSWPMHTQTACYFLLAKSNNVKQQQQHCWYVWTCCVFLLTSTCHV